MVYPIFGLGLARNGTTWLQNVLCNHEEIIGAQHKAHWGSKESHVCRNIRYWGDFKETDRFIRFLELYSSGDHFKLADGDKEYFYQNRPRDFINFFFEIMDNYAKKEDGSYWTTKLDVTFYTHPELLEEFINRAEDRYDEIKFIGIQRDYEDVLRSAINMQAFPWRKKFGLREVFAIFDVVKNAHGYNTINRIIDKRDGLKLEFDELRNDRAVVIDKIVNYLDLDHSEEMLEDHYPPNSSYRAEEEKATLPDWEEKLIAKCLFSALQKDNLLNRKFRRAIDRLLNNYFPNDRPISWRLIKLEKFSERFREELKEEGRIGLEQALFDEDDD